MKIAHSVPVLMYHHISPSPGIITTSPANFESQLAWLADNGYRTLTTAEFGGHIEGRRVPDKSILITFDDGYLDNWVYAYPLLKKYGFKASVFLVTSWIHDGPARPHLGHGELPETPSHRECGLRIAQDRSDDVILRWSEIRAMRDAGVFEFHSHTHTHTRWDLSDQSHEKNQLMAQELALSRQALQLNLGSVSDHFCWPQGYFDQDYIRLAKEAGFVYFYTTDAYGRNTEGSHTEHIYRIAVRNRDGATLGRRIRLAANLVWGPWYNRWKSWRKARRRRQT